MEKCNPEISIIVPSYNEEKNIRRCLDSLLNQTFEDFEVICVDDNSTDNTYEILKEYSEKDSRIKHFKNTGKGVSSARNLGLDKVSGNYIGFVDSDDFTQPQMLEFLFKAIKENDCDMAICSFERVRTEERKTFEYNCRECTCDEFVSLTDNNFVLDNEMKVSAVWLRLVNKKLLSDNIVFEKFVIGEDTVFCSKLWTRANRVMLVDLPLYCYYINSESITHAPYSDKRWLDLISTRFLAYDEYLKYKNKKISDFFLHSGIMRLIYFRFFSKGTENEKLYKVETGKLFKKYAKKFLKNNAISIKSKIMFFAFYYCPLLYKIYRKHYYGNERP